jgi:beta-1,4-mannosyltransferase
VKLCSGCTFIIDWHNFGYTILALALGPRHPLVTAAYYYERVLGRFSDANLCVTRAMREWLRAEWGVQASVLHDKAPAIFRRLPLHEVHELWTRLQQDPKLSCLLGSMHVDCKRGDTILTSASSSSSSSSRRKSSSKKRKGSAKGKRGSRKSPKGAEGVSWREGRPAVLISSTSWTADEDINVLLEAVKECEAHLLRAHKKKKKKEKDAAASPQLLVLITGKGPMRAMYEEQIEGLGLQMTAIKTLWLEAEDYPRLLGSADLGVSLHTSSSGLDLPMKVVDMFGAQLPVCAIDFKCLGELVQHQQNGLVFQDSAQLAAQLVEYVLEDRPGFAKIEELRTGVADFTETRWDDAWRVSALPFFRPLSSLS